MIRAMLVRTTARGSGAFVLMVVIIVATLAPFVVAWHLLAPLGGVVQGAALIVGILVLYVAGFAGSGRSFGTR